MPELTYLRLRELAQATRLPVSWIKREVKAGRLPHILAGRRLVFDLEAVRAALAERSRVEGTARG